MPSVATTIKMKVAYKKITASWHLGAHKSQINRPYVNEKVPL